MLCNSNLVLFSVTTTATMKYPTVDDALAFAKQRARQQATRPTSRSIMEVGLGEGRKTREVELIWWPRLYSHSYYGKLTVRFYVRKTSI